MSKITEKIEKQTYIESLRNTLENAAQELDSLYEGDVVVRRGKTVLQFDTFTSFSSEEPIQYIAEEKRFLGIPYKRKKIFSIREHRTDGFYDFHSEGNKLKKSHYMEAFLPDDKVETETIMKKHLDQYAEECDITEIHIHHQPMKKVYPKV